MTHQVTIYHNPRCSKSRQTLQLLEDMGVKPRIIEYLKTPPSTNSLKTLLLQLGFTEPRQLMRRNETIYQTLNLSDHSLSDDMLLQAMHDNPILIERPIVVVNGHAQLGRPPELVKKLFK
ncbi:arsenate reductase (glutaredoxin) [Arsenophonus nasoniae]|uniref:Arsenate reductase n=1 Tax=Arsenophonus nasoniae TaxID=638 RepID=D2U219_9GAMM|nr:arsenate reductase (glutaredoxin) [Arsenophonus nasoniae]QBY43781.1 Arsenate reductase [Arsenophonus nasoniae]WGM00147.1 arsenate reductase (glutaredoxin) [Arsenophonus nasoniae]WGM04136.1 arsenate reductase (glutaredoxin) [Arsenophonus nasoniae]WGM09241.1 arsenate reductase (glutaredoxin) [Arsenophonus nasoniae]WGM13963.1 arsenate reductase (glutaredoxin) [Arsenophonus nasoniae]